MSFKKFYVWKVLSEDGLLKDHKPIGPYYSEITFNEEFDTESEAVETLNKWLEHYEHRISSEFVLIQIYRRVWE